MILVDYIPAPGTLAEATSDDARVIMGARWLRGSVHLVIGAFLGPWWPAA
jgi:hypothetical protein